MKKVLIPILLIVIIFTGVWYSIYRRRGKVVVNSNTGLITNPSSPVVSSDIVSSNSPTMNPTISPIITITTAPVSQNNLTEPVSDFKKRVTKKPFGIYITPQNSPISPERFMGFHTGADAEYQDVIVDVPVYAVSDGKVVLSEIASGYGGVFMIEIDLSGSKHTVLYGHIRPSALPKVGQKVVRGEQIAVLGTGYSSETDGERRHLHFAILTDSSLNIKGYVSTKSQLSSWLDPLLYL